MTFDRRLPFRVLYEDNHLLVVDKPASLPTMGSESGRPSLLSEAKSYIAAKYGKPGNVYLGVVSRLDASVTGAIVLARTSKAAARLSSQFAERRVHKLYWAIAAPAPDPPAGECVDWLRKDESRHRMQVVGPHAAGAQAARLRYETLRSLPRGALLAIELETGRKHQIRLQLSERGWPIVGDAKYGSPLSFAKGIALHSRELTFEHPTQRTPLSFSVPVPDYWKAWGVTPDADVGPAED